MQRLTVRFCCYPVIVYFNFTHLFKIPIYFCCMHQPTSRLVTIPIVPVALFWLTFMLLLVLAGVLSGMFPSGVSRLVYGFGGTLAAWGSTYLILRLQNTSFTFIGLYWERNSIFRFITGVIIGGVTLAAMLWLLHVLAGFNWTSNEKVWSGATILSYIAILPLAFMEEIAFRAYPFIILQRRYGIWVAQIVSAVAFALYHIPGGNGLLGVLLGPGIWGLIFGIAAAWSRGIAVPLGIHVALNAGQMIMGMKGSDDALWKISDSGRLTSSATFDVNQVGVAMQLGVLVIAISLTFLYKKLKQDTVDGYGY
jgi:membrane protease YdiL (CAAX protease family)